MDQAITQAYIVEQEAIDTNKKPMSLALFNLDDTPWTPPSAGDADIDTDVDLGGEETSDDKIPSQKAVKTYVDAQIAGVEPGESGPTQGIAAGVSFDEATGWGAGAFNPDTTPIPGYIPIPLGTPTVTYSLSGVNTATSMRLWSAGGPGEMLTDPVDLLVVDNLLKYVLIAQGVSAQETAQLWWIVSSDGVSVTAVQLPLNPLQEARIDEILAAYDFPEQDLSGLVTDGELETEASDILNEVTSWLGDYATSVEVVTALEDYATLEAFNEYKMKNPHMVAHFSWIMDCRFEVNPQIDGRTRSPGPGVHDMLDNESVLVLRPLDDEYSGVWLGHVNVGYGEGPADPDGDFAWWERPSSQGGQIVYIPGKHGDGSVNEDDTNPLVENFENVNYYDGDLRFPRPFGLEAPEVDYGFGTYWSQLQWSNFIACSRKGSYPDVLFFMLEFNGLYSGLPMSNEIQFQAGPPTLTVLGARDPDTPLNRYAIAQWLDVNNNASYLWDVGDQQWKAFISPDVVISENIHAGSTPNITIGDDAGSGAAIACSPETDSWGEIGGVAGTSAAPGEFAVLTFDAPWLRPGIQLTAKSPEAAALNAYYIPIDSGANTVGFSLCVVGTPSNGVTYLWSYSVLGG